MEGETEGGGRGRAGECLLGQEGLQLLALRSNWRATNARLRHLLTLMLQLELELVKNENLTRQLLLRGSDDVIKRRKHGET